MKRADFAVTSLSLSMSIHVYLSIYINQSPISLSALALLTVAIYLFYICSLHIYTYIYISFSHKFQNKCQINLDQKVLKINLKEKKSCCTKCRISINFHGQFKLQLIYHHRFGFHVFKASLACIPSALPGYAWLQPGAGTKKDSNILKMSRLSLSLSLSLSLFLSLSLSLSSLSPSLSHFSISLLLILGPSVTHQILENLAAKGKQSLQTRSFSY